MGTSSVSGASLLAIGINPQFLRDLMGIFVDGCTLRRGLERRAERSGVGQFPRKLGRRHHTAWRKPGASRPRGRTRRRRGGGSSPGVSKRSRPAAEDRLARPYHTDAHDTDGPHTGALHTDARHAELAQPAARLSPEDVALVTELHHGGRLRGETALRIACDAGLVVAKTIARDQVLDIGRRSRTAASSFGG